jgi:hypothetical protein
MRGGVMKAAVVLWVGLPLPLGPAWAQGLGAGSKRLDSMAVEAKLDRNAPTAEASFEILVIDAVTGAGPASNDPKLGRVAATLAAPPYSAFPGFKLRAELTTTARHSNGGQVHPLGNGLSLTLDPVAVENGRVTCDISLQQAGAPATKVRQAMDTRSNDWIFLPAPPRPGAAPTFVAIKAGR